MSKNQKKKIGELKTFSKSMAVEIHESETSPKYLLSVPDLDEGEKTSQKSLNE